MLYILVAITQVVVVDVNSVINLAATMSQMCKLVDGGEGTSQQVKQTAATASPVTDWTHCVLCQSVHVAYGLCGSRSEYGLKFWLS